MLLGETTDVVNYDFMRVRLIGIDGNTNRITTSGKVIRVHNQNKGT